jgi:hypothetical protein
MTLKSDIESWDTKSTLAITRVYAKHMDRAQFLPELIDLIPLPTTEIGATWILKHHLDEDSSPLPDQLIQEVYKHLPKLTHWESKLHILQIMEHLPIPSKHKASTLNFINNCKSSDNKFVRAWSYHGQYQLALNFPKLRDQARSEILHASEHDEAASVRARCRQLLKLSQKHWQK